MGLQQYKDFLLVITVVAALFIASPAIQQILVIPQTDFLTEFSLLGPYHNATYPSQHHKGENYRLYLGLPTT